MEIVTKKIGERNAKLVCYIQSPSPEMQPFSNARPAMLVLPGGGYEFCSDRENEPIALTFAAEGYQAFALTYSIKENGHYPIPQHEAFEAIAYIRTHAEELFVDPTRVAVIGFSAGGHLAASTGVFWENKDCIGSLDPALCRPDATVLCYPCITSEEQAYPGIASVHGVGVKDLSLISLDKQVNEKTSPAYICHVAADTCVPVANSLLYAKALGDHGVPYELHVFKDGWHGMSKGYSGAVADLRIEDRNFEAVGIPFAKWVGESIAFLHNVLDKKKA